MTAIPSETGRLPVVESISDLMRALRREEEVRAGDVIGDCTVLRFIGSGGEGAVFEAEQAPLGRRVLVKVLSAPVSDDGRERFMQARQLQAELVHQGIVPVLAAGRDAGREYMVMPHARGVDLRDALRAVWGEVGAADWAGTLDLPALLARVADGRDRDHVRPWLLSAPPPPPLPDDPPTAPVRMPVACFRWACDRLIEMADALHAAHEKGILHLDVKPQNVLVEASGNARVFDFGIGRRLARGSAKAGGTDGYSAPEVLNGEPADATADVYSLGRCLIDLATLGTRGNAGAVVPPPDLAAIARKATAAQPADRYPTAAAFAEDVKRVLRGEPTTARPRSTPVRLWMWVRRHPWRAAAVATVFVSVLAVVLTVAAVRVAGAEAAREQAEFAGAVVSAERELAVAVRRTGWTKRVAARLGEALRARPGDDVRDTAADTLSGLDAVSLLQHDTPAVAGRWAGFGRVAFSPNGSQVVAGGFWQPGKLMPSPAAVWDGNHLANKPVESTRAGAGPVAFPDAGSPLTLLSPTGDDTSLVLWNVATNKTVAELPLPGKGTVGPTDRHPSASPAALSPDAAFAAAVFVPASKEDKAKPAPRTLVWAIDRKAGTAKIVAGWEGEPTALAFSPDGKLLATGTEAGDVSVRTAADGKELLDLRAGHLEVTALGFGRNFWQPGRKAEQEGPAAGWLLGVGSHGGDLSAWDLRGTPTRVNSFHGSEEDVFAVAFSPDGTTLFSGGRYAPIAWDVATARQVLKFVRGDHTMLQNWCEGVAIAPAGDRVTFGGTDPFSHHGGLDVFRLDADRGVRTYRGLSGTVAQVWHSPDGRFVAALSTNWQLGVWERGGRARFVANVAGWTSDNTAVAFDADSVWFSSGTRASRFDLATGAWRDGWELPRGLDDHFVPRPGKTPLLVRQDRGGRADAPAVIRARELKPNGELADVYDLAKAGLHRAELVSVTTDGRQVVHETTSDGRQRSHLFDTATGKPVEVKWDILPDGAWANLSEGGTVAWAQEPKAERTVVVRMSDGKRLATHPTELFAVDDAGKLGLVCRPDDRQRPWENGVAVYRIGEDRPLVTFDLGRATMPGSLRLSPDGKFVSWGRRDGTVCLVDDLNACLERLSPFGKR